MNVSRATTRRAQRPMRALAVAALLAVPLLALRTSLRDSLHTLYFPSGWILGGAVVWFALAWWWPVANARAFRRKLDRQLGLSALLVVLFAVHIDFRSPTGLLDGALTVGFGLLLLSLGVGVLLSWSDARLDRARRDVRLERWQSLHVAVALGLLSLSAVHATLVHAHGMMAYLIKGEFS